MILIRSWCNSRAPSLTCLPPSLYHTSVHPAPRDRCFSTHTHGRLWVCLNDCPCMYVRLYYMCFLCHIHTSLSCETFNSRPARNILQGGCQVDSEGHTPHLQDGGWSRWNSGSNPRAWTMQSYLHIYAYYSLPSVWFPWRVCLPGDLQGSAGAAELLPPRSHQGYSPSALKPRPGRLLQRWKHNLSLLKCTCWI